MGSVAQVRRADRYILIKIGRSLTDWACWPHFEGGPGRQKRRLSWCSFAEMPRAAGLSLRQAKSDPAAIAE
jgi:hypothetical protein